MDKASLITQLKNYRTSSLSEKRYVPLFLDLLQEEQCFLRQNLSRHITGSAWIVSHDFQSVLLVHHKKLNRWLQPGGHADGDEDIMQVALKEAREETGITNFERVYPNIFDIDIHTIPSRKNIPEHDHYDIRFTLSALENTDIQKNDESHEVAWFTFAEIENVTNGNASIMRMVEKTKKQFLLSD